MGGSRSVALVAGVLSVAVAAIGVWFWQTESDFAHRFDNDLAAKLQWIGIALTLIGVAGALLAAHVIRGRDRDG